MLNTESIVEAGGKKAIVTADEALRIIGIVTGLTLFGLGIYLIGPWYMAPAGAGLSSAAAISVYFIKAVSIFMIVTGAGFIHGGVLGHNKYTKVATWLGVSMLALILVSRLISIGFLPVVWVFELALLLIAGVLALTVVDR